MTIYCRGCLRWIFRLLCPYIKAGNIFRKIMRMMEQAQENMKYSLEIVFVNDYPEEGITDKDVDSMIIPVKLVVNGRNRGIHYSRVKGLERFGGQYILFLDQDDEIGENYFSEQMKYMDDNDAVLCNGKFRGNKKIYKSETYQEQMIEKCNYFLGQSRIVSPEQVLLKKSSIPKQWKENILGKNESDDLLLWFLMLHENRKFGINPAVLYRHIEEVRNSSLNFIKMKESVAELRNVICKNHLLSREETDIVIDGCNRRISKFEKYIEILGNWDGIIEYNLKSEF